MLKAIRKRIKEYRYKRKGKWVDVPKHFRTYHVKAKKKVKKVSRKVKKHKKKVIASSIVVAGTTAAGIRKYREKYYTPRKVPIRITSKMVEEAIRDILPIGIPLRVLPTGEKNVFEVQFPPPLEGLAEYFLRHANQDPSIESAIRQGHVVRIKLKDAYETVYPTPPHRKVMRGVKEIAPIVIVSGALLGYEIHSRKRKKERIEKFMNALEKMIRPGDKNANETVEVIKDFLLQAPDKVVDAVEDIITNNEIIGVSIEGSEGTYTLTLETEDKNYYIMTSDGVWTLHGVPKD